LPAVQLHPLRIWLISSLPEATHSTMPSVVVSTSSSPAPLLHKCWLARSHFRSAVVLMHGSCRQRRQLTSRICATPASATATEGAATSKWAAMKHMSRQHPGSRKLHRPLEVLINQVPLATIIWLSLVRGEHDWQLSIAQAN